MMPTSPAFSPSSSRRERGQPCRRELQRQRDAVESATDRGRRQQVIGCAHGTGRHRLRPVEEQAGRGEGGAPPPPAYSSTAAGGSPVRRAAPHSAKQRASTTEDHRQPVAPALSGQPIRVAGDREGPPQLRHPQLERVQRIARQLFLRPQRLDQSADRDHPASRPSSAHRARSPRAGNISACFDISSSNGPKSRSFITGPPHRSTPGPTHAFSHAHPGQRLNSDTSTPNGRSIRRCWCHRVGLTVHRGFHEGFTTRSARLPTWRSIPSWYLLATRYNTIPPKTQAFMAKRAQATVPRVRASHVAMQSHPAATTKLILTAARAVR